MPHSERPYTDLKSYLEYKKRGVDKLRAHEKEIAPLKRQAKPKRKVSFHHLLLRSNAKVFNPSWRAKFKDSLIAGV